jgi:hypothetical protein
MDVISVRSLTDKVLRVSTSYNFRYMCAHMYLYHILPYEFVVEVC